MVSPWRQYAAQTIQLAISNCQSSDPKAIKKAIREAYPFGERENHPYKIWLSEVKKKLRELGIDNGKLGPINLGHYKCKWCKDAGCLVCITSQKKVNNHANNSSSDRPN